MTSLQRIFMLIVVGQTLILSGGSIFEFKKNKQLMREVFSSRAEYTGQSIGEAFGILYCDGKTDAAKKLLEKFHSRGSFEFASISFAGKLLASAGPSELVALSTRDIVEQQAAFERSQIFVTYAEVPACRVGEAAGELEIGYSYQGLDAPLKSQLITQGKILFAQTALLFLAIFLFGKLLQKQLKRVIDRCKKIASGVLDEDRLFGWSNEFFVVSETLNSMCKSLSDLQKEKEDQRVQIVSTSKLTALGEMAGGVAHEINNPLTIIDGNIYKLRLALDSPSPNLESVVKSITTIESMSHRIAKIVRGLRSFSRDGSQDPYSRTSVKSIIEDTLPLCQAKFNQSSVDLRIGDHNDFLTVDCRSTEISQVLLNLLNNAFDAILERQEKWVQIETADDGEFVIIRVIDSGVGIPQDVQKKMLQPFFTTKAVGKGTGLGLSISIGIIKAHKGTLEIDNNCKNTCFVLKLPKAEQQLIRSVS